MTLVNTETGEIVAECSPEYARRITDEIKADAEALRGKLLEAHDLRAWAALGYESWRTYALAEFGMSQTRAYQLLDAAQIVRAIGEHTDSTMVEIPLPANERQARALVPLKAEPARMADAMQRAGTTPTAARIAEAVKDIVREEITKAAQRTEDREALGELAESIKRAGLDMNPDRVRQRGEFSRLCKDIAALPDPVAFIADHGEHLRDRHGTQAVEAHQWLTNFCDAWENR